MFGDQTGVLLAIYGVYSGAMIRPTTLRASRLRFDHSAFGLYPASSLLGKHARNFAYV
jgi:hypothetical protein